MKHTILYGVIVVTFSAACGLVGCASTPPPRDLLDAREAYRLAEASPGATRAQVELDEAKQTLAVAEAVNKDNPGSQAAHDWTYIAARKAGSARAKANAITMAAQANDEKTELKALVAQQQAQNASEIANARGEAKSERSARVAAEQKTNDALSKIAGMKSMMGPRGLVLTLSGSVLFATNKSDLLPAAQTRLMDVAKAVAEDGRSIDVMGYTDSTGSDDLNDKLSSKRASSVATFLVAHGVDQMRVRTEGKGKSDPIADNKTPDGRANNRRVEIVLENADGFSSK